MSLLQEMFDRLSGVSALRERMNDLRATLESHQRFLLDHERRLARLEAGRPKSSPKKDLSKDI